MLDDDALPSFETSPGDMLDETQREISQRARDNADEGPGPGQEENPADPMMAPTHCSHGSVTAATGATEATAVTEATASHGSHGSHGSW